VPRFRTTAIAALAATALLATSGAAYARDLHLKKVERAASSAPSMSWAYFHGELTDIWPNDKVFDGAQATAMMVAIDGSSFFRVRLRGLEKSDPQDFGAHLHVGPCGLTDPTNAATTTVGVHYNTDVLGKISPVRVNDQTEVWLNFHVNSEGNAQATATVPFVPSPGDNGLARSITFHRTPTVKEQTDPNEPKVGSAGDKLACLPLDIKSLKSSN
jgi:Cu/Zn superoxide dismutase